MRRLTAGVAGLVAVALTTTAVAQPTIIEVELRTRDLIHEPISGRLYASIPGSVGVDGNSITWIEPTTGWVGPFAFVGDNPEPLATSEDGKFLYVGLDDASAVRQFDLEAHQIAAWIELGSGLHGPHHAEDIEVQPGTNDVIAVSRFFKTVSPRHAGVAVFEGTTQRSDTTLTAFQTNVIEFSADPATAYGYNNETTEFGFRTLEIDQDGIRQTSTMPTAIEGFLVDIEYHQGIIYATNGAAIDPVTGATLGTFDVADATALAIDAAADRIYFLHGGSIHTFQLSTFVFVETIDVPGASGQTSSLVRWGSTGLAFRTSQDRVFILSFGPERTMEVSPPSADYLDSQDFDLAVLVTSPDADVIGIASAQLGGLDITARLGNCLVAGTTDDGRQSLRCPRFAQRILRRLGPGLHTLTLEIELSDASTLTTSATWNVIETTE